MAGPISASLRQGNTAPFEKMSQRWRAVGNTVSDLTCSKFEPQTSRSRDERVPARPTNRPEIANTDVLFRTSAVRVINPRTGNLTLVYAQHDTVFQVTLVSERLVNELDLNVNTNHALNIRTHAEQTIKSAGCIELKVQSLTTNVSFLR